MDDQRNGRDDCLSLLEERQAIHDRNDAVGWGDGSKRVPNLSRSYPPRSRPDVRRNPVRPREAGNAVHPSAANFAGVEGSADPKFIDAELRCLHNAYARPFACFCKQTDDLVPVQP